MRIAGCGHPATSRRGPVGAYCDGCRPIGEISTRLNEAAAHALSLASTYPELQPLARHLRAIAKDPIAYALDRERRAEAARAAREAAARAAAQVQEPSPPLPPAPALPPATPDRPRPREAYERIGGEPGWMDPNRW